MQVKILSNEEFEALPYPDMSRSLGVADPRNRTAYVRETGLPILDTFNLAHELEHLKDGHSGAHADHYRNGVYYKDIGEVFTQLGSVIPGPWQPVAQIGGAMQARQAQKKAKGEQESMMRDQMMGGGGQGTMESFQPQISQPNIITPGQTPGFGGGMSEGGQGGGGAIERVRGFFSGRNPL